MAGEKSDLGVKGEDLAVRYLMNKGFQIIERNFRCRMGEIDIVARDDNYLVFVEVRTRSRTKYGLALESITNSKINKLRLLASLYLVRHPQDRLFIRFDVVAVNWTEDTEITHIENAF